MIRTRSRTGTPSSSARSRGSTELLPISSSGHLILVPWAAEWTFLEQNDRFNQTFDVALHLGTLIAVGAYFWSDLVALVRAFVGTLGRRRIETPEERVAWLVAVATLPAGIVGFFGADFIADNLGEPWQIAIFLAAGAILLWVADRSSQDRTMGDLGIGHGVVIGSAQALALAAGVSRSGITITAGRFLRLDRDSAARLSFLLVVPTVLGAVVFKGVEDVLLGELPQDWHGPFVVGTLASLGSGLLAIDWMLGYLRRHTYDVFVVYRLIAAAIIALLILTGVREATF